MILTIIATLALVHPAPADTNAPTAQAGPVRVWLADTVMRVGTLARAYVQMAAPGHLAVLHVEPSGRIRVLFPARPEDDDVVPGGTFVVSGVDDSATFRVAGPGVGTLLAVRSWTPLDYDVLRAADADRWDYAHALLLQPTAGVPLAALLDIADRLAAGEAYVYDVAEYRTPGAVVARRTPPDSVCFACLAARHTGQTSSGVASAALAVDQSYAVVPGTYMVDCADATVDNALCGVQDNRSYTTVKQTDISQPPIYAYPVGLPLFIGRRRERRLPRGGPPRDHAVALNLRRVPGAVVPPPRRRMPPIVVEQPHAPSHPQVAMAPQPTSGAAPAPVSAAIAPAAPRTRVIVIHRPTPHPSRAPAGAPRFELVGGAPSAAAVSPRAAPPSPSRSTTAIALPHRAVIVPKR